MENQILEIKIDANEAIEIVKNYEIEEIRKFISLIPNLCKAYDEPIPTKTIKHLESFYGVK